MKTIVYCCPFVPAEWIAAHGLRPKRIIPHFSNGISQLGQGIGICPYARAFIHTAFLVENADAVVVTTVCDQMRRVWELMGSDQPLPLFLMNVSSTWQTELSRNMYRDELLRLGRFLVRLGGTSPIPDTLFQIMEEYADKRSNFLNQRTLMGSRINAESLSQLNYNNDFHFNNSNFVLDPSGIPLALVGGPWVYQHFSLYDQIELAGGTIFLDATGNGERPLPIASLLEDGHHDSLTALVQAYFGHIPDAFRRPNIGLTDWLMQKIRERGIKGIIYVHYIWCDTWHAEIHNLMEKIKLPSLVLELGDNEINPHQVSCRIEAFLEMFR